MLKKIILILFLFIAPVNAQIIIEDQETQDYLFELIKPIYKAAGINFDPNKVHIVLDDNINAFVISGGHLFMNTGLIIRAKNSNEISGVIAHEAGHIKAGHIFKQKLKIKELRTVSLASMLLAGLAGAATGSGEVAMAGMYGSQGALMGQFLQYKKEDERSADDFAVKTLKKANVPNEDLLNFLKRLQQQNQTSGVQELEYFTTHPLTSERIAFLEENKTKSKSVNDKKLKNIQAKLEAFIYDPQKTIKKYYDKNHYATAIAMFKALKIKEALDYVKWLITTDVKNPYYYELEGQIYYETARPEKAAKSYQKALDLLPNSSYYKVYLAQSLIEAYGDEENISKAISLLKQANISQKRASNYLLLARAYGKLDDTPNALLASAEYSLRIGNKELAKKQAEKAKKMTKDKKLLILADDIIGVD